MNQPPKLFRAIASSGQGERIDLGLFITKAEAQGALDAELDNFHESIAFESDRHHIALDKNFKQYSKIEEV
jgi:hypothetical protein